MQDRVILWSLSLNRELTSADFLNTPMAKGETKDIKFVVKNLSTEYTASNIVVKIKNVGIIYPNFTEQILFSLDEVTFVEILSLGNIPPTSLSREITMRQMARKDAVSGNYSLIVDMADWII